MNHLSLLPDCHQNRLENRADDDLMGLVRHGIEPAFKAIIERHQALVMGYAARFLNDRVLAREIAQDVFVAVWNERERYQPQGRFRSFLLSLTVNRCKYAARQRRRTQDTLARAGAVPSSEEVPESALDRLIAEERASEVRRLLLELDERTRTALTLRFVSGLGYAEIATATGQPEGTLKAQVSRGIKRLHALWTKEHRS
jgi:RNA polymerase sigma-70 factor, ECF subfamily